MGIKMKGCTVVLDGEGYHFTDEEVLNAIKRRTSRTDLPMFIEGFATVKDGESKWYVTINLNQVKYIYWHIEETDEEPEKEEPTAIMLVDKPNWM